MTASHSAASQQFFGGWNLVSWTATAPDGTLRHPYGEHPIGRILYHPDGLMSASLMRSGRASFASENRHEATAEERAAAYYDFMSYFGSFTVEEAAGTVTHHVDGATFPNWIGTDLVRSYDFAGDQLTLSLERPDGTRHALVWQRHSQ